MTQTPHAAQLAAQPFQALVAECLPDMIIVDFDGATVTLRSRDYPDDRFVVCSLFELLEDMAALMKAADC